MIEDNPDDVYLIKRLIGLAASVPALALETVDTLAGGLARLEQGGIDAILLDLSLPDSSGLSTLTTLQQRAPQLPVVVQTGLSDEDLGIEAVRHGAQDYLIKGEANIHLLVRALRYAIERKRTEEELRRHREKLELLVAERTGDLQRANEQLQQEIVERERAEQRALALAVRQERARVLASFIQATSHDFRTPLSTINTSLYLIRRLSDPDERVEHLNLIEHQTARLAKLVDGMLRLLNLEMGMEFDFQPTDLNTLVSDLRFRVYSDAAAKNIRIATELDPALPPVAADSTELSRALVALVENAIAYSPPGASVTIRTHLNASHVEVVVEDHGVGISEEDLPYIFDLLYRADKARSAETGGPGLGLSIAQKIIAAHHGTIDVASVVGQGSTFRVVLPLSQ